MAFLYIKQDRDYISVLVLRTLLNQVEAITIQLQMGSVWKRGNDTLWYSCIHQGGSPSCYDLHMAS